MEENLPTWAWPMWHMTFKTGNKNRLAALYVKFLNNIVKTRDLIEGYVTKK
jgi:hypothetical protein